MEDMQTISTGADYPLTVALPQNPGSTSMRLCDVAMYKHDL